MQSPFFRSPQRRSLCTRVSDEDFHHTADPTCPVLTSQVIGNTHDASEAYQANNQFSSAVSHSVNQESNSDSHSSHKRRSHTFDGGQDYKTLIQEVLARYSKQVEASRFAVKRRKHSHTKAEQLNQVAEKPAAGTVPIPCTYQDGGMHSPQECDVLFGRGKTAKNHAGNCQLKQICDLTRMTYDRSSRDEKTNLTRNIVHDVKSRGGRFLKFNEYRNVWFEVTDEEARQKVAHMFRDGRLQPLRRMETETPGSSK